MEPRTVFVTGSSRGIGRAIALRLARDGFRVAIHFAKHRAAAQDVETELGAACAGVFGWDFLENPRGDQLWDIVQSKIRVDALVNNAGVYQTLDFVDAEDDAFDANFSRMLGVNFEAPLRLTRAACQTFAQRGGGKVVNIGSRVGFKGEGGASLYAASKAALINLGRSLAVELAGKNVQVYSVTPGWVETAMVRKDLQERLQEVIASIPLGRAASPEDCAGAVAFLLSADADYLSGIAIDVNGASYFH